MKAIIAAVVTFLCLGMVAGVGVAQNTAATVAGKWHFVLDTGDDTRDVDATFAQDGKNVTGKFGKGDVKGTFADGKLNLEFHFDSDEVGPGTMKISGELGTDVLTGKWSFQEYGGPYKATRLP